LSTSGIGCNDGDHPLEIVTRKSLRGKDLSNFLSLTLWLEQDVFAFDR
jgi:hypothetical protein